MDIVFMGTPEFAVPSLETLIHTFNVKAVFTQPDRPKGRGNKIAFSPVKEVTLKYGIKIYQPERIKKEPGIIEELRALKPDFIVVVAYGQILSKEILDIPRYGCINLHGSLLPKYRGAAPIQWAIINGEKYSGNTTQLMDEGCDTGDILLKSKHEITEDMTAGELYEILMKEGGDLLVETLKGYSSGDIKPVKQNHEESCHAPLLDKKLAKIDWNKSALEIKNLIRGLNPWPLAHCEYKGVIMKIYKAKALVDSLSEETPGKILKVNNEGIFVATSKGILIIDVLQFPGGKPLKVEQYIRGNSIEVGEILK